MSANESVDAPILNPGQAARAEAARIARGVLADSSFGSSRRPDGYTLFAEDLVRVADWIYTGVLPVPYDLTENGDDVTGGVTP